MDKVNKLFAQYAALHRQGAQPDEIFAALRPEIEALSPKERLNLRSRVRAWRAGTIQAPRLTTLGKMMDDPAPRAPEGFTGLADVLAMEYEEAGAAPPAAAEAVPAGPDHTACPYCGVNNPTDEVICQGCGHILAVNSPHATRSLAQTKEFFLNHEFFGSDYTLELRVRDTNQVYTLRPQDRAGGELVLGRNIAEGKALKVDVDLGDQHAEALGVSRLHLGLRYDTDYQTIQVYDVGSANGSFLDGQRLHRNERRILRDGDELRLGRLVMRVKFVRPA